MSRLQQQMDSFSIYLFFCLFIHSLVYLLVDLFSWSNSMLDVGNDLFKVSLLLMRNLIVIFVLNVLILIIYHSYDSFQVIDYHYLEMGLNCSFEYRD